MPDLDTLSTVLATDLHEGDYIVNVGEVQVTPSRFGVWVLVELVISRPGVTSRPG